MDNTNCKVPLYISASLYLTYCKRYSIQNVLVYSPVYKFEFSQELYFAPGFFKTK
jgi:hypothetical protein